MSTSQRVHDGTAWSLQPGSVYTVNVFSEITPVFYEREEPTSASDRSHNAGPSRRLTACQQRHDSPTNASQRDLGVIIDRVQRPPSGPYRGDRQEAGRGGGLGAVAQIVALRTPAINSPVIPAATGGPQNVMLYFGLVCSKYTANMHSGGFST